MSSLELARPASLPREPADAGSASAIGLQHAERELRRWSLASLVTVTCTAAVLGAWATLAPLDGAVVARGQLRAEDHRQLVQHQEGGLVKAIFVRNGSQVRKGQPLIEIDDTRVAAGHELLSQQRDAETVRQARLAAERDLLTELVLPESIGQRRSAPAMAALFKSEQALFRQRRQTLDLQVGILQQQISEVEREVSAVRQQIEADEAARHSMDAEVRQNATLQERGFITSARVLTLQRGLADYQSRLSEHRADLSRALQKQNELRLKIEEARNAYRQAAVVELMESTRRLNDLKQQLRPIGDAQRRQVMVAPVDGEVVALRVHTLGASLGPRETVMEVVPAGDRLVLEVKLPLESLTELRTGMPADVRLLAFQHRSTPLVAGTLTYVSADALTDADGQTHYLGHVRLDAESLAASRTGPLQPGMPAEVFLRTRTRTALDYLVDPIRMSMTRAFRER